MLQQQVKIFMGFGKDGVNKVEEDINTWLSQNQFAEILNTQTALCQVAETPTGERYQCLVVTVWHKGQI